MATVAGSDKILIEPLLVAAEEVPPGAGATAPSWAGTGDDDDVSLTILPIEAGAELTLWGLGGVFAIVVVGLEGMFDITGASLRAVDVPCWRDGIDSLIILLSSSSIFQIRVFCNG